MPYTVWKNGDKIGETRFELHTAPQRLAGVFHPTPSGLSVLPAITAMAATLIEFGHMCRSSGITIDDDRPDSFGEALDAFANTPEGQRMQTAASHVAGLELRDPSGRTLAWEAILISDLTAFAKVAGHRESDVQNRLKKLPGDPIRFMISTTLAEPGEPASLGPFGAAEPLEVS